MNAKIEIINFSVNDIITTSTVTNWEDGNVTPPTPEEP